ncbi:UNVERIFIED_CONTAM: hypothetical protein FKN15_075616 [Acipenser sinensis]
MSTPKARKMKMTAEDDCEQDGFSDDVRPKTQTQEVAEYLCHVYVRNDSLSAVVIADNEYPSRVCFTLLDKVLDEFSKQVDRIDWPSGSPTTINYTALDGYLAKYQNPREADAMSKVQAELDETKIILHNTMESLLERGEKLDDLVQKSEHLGNQSKAFYKTSVPQDLTQQEFGSRGIHNGPRGFSLRPSPVLRKGSSSVGDLFLS